MDFYLQFCHFLQYFAFQKSFERPKNRVDDCSPTTSEKDLEERFLKILSEELCLLQPLSFSNFGKIEIPASGWCPDLSAHSTLMEPLWQCKIWNTEETKNLMLKYCFGDPLKLGLEQHKVFYPFVLLQVSNVLFFLVSVYFLILFAIFSLC